jgi:hypothetical protein
MWLFQEVYPTLVSLIPVFIEILILVYYNVEGLPR